MTDKIFTIPSDTLHHGTNGFSRGRRTSAFLVCPAAARHLFIKSLLAIVLVAAILFTVAGCSGAEKNAREPAAVFVESEFAPLKKVIVSRSEATDQVLLLSESYIPQEEIEAEGGEVIGDKVLFRVDQEEMRKMELERDSLAALLEQYGVEVLRPRALTEKEISLATDPAGPSHGMGLTNFFVRDPFVVVGGHVIESNFRKESRRYEALTARSFFWGISNYVAMPMPAIDDEEAGPFLEGGDVLVYHKQVFVGNSGFASSEAGVQWLRDYLSPYGYEVIEVRLQGNILHLDCAMSLVREGLMIVCEESFADGIPETFKDWDKISVSENDAEHLAVNGLPINEEVYVTDIAFKDTIGKELEARGVKVEYLDFSVTRGSMGSIHCSTQPVLRADD